MVPGLFWITTTPRFPGLRFIRDETTPPSLYAAVCFEFCRILRAIRVIAFSFILAFLLLPSAIAGTIAMRGKCRLFDVHAGCRAIDIASMVVSRPILMTTNVVSFDSYVT